MCCHWSKNCEEKLYSFANARLDHIKKESLAKHCNQRIGINFFNWNKEQYGWDDSIQERNLIEEAKNVEVALFPDIPAEMQGVWRMKSEPGLVFDVDATYNDNEYAMADEKNYIVVKNELCDTNIEV